MKFDLLVITASNAAQAEVYRRLSAPLIGKIAGDIIVEPDPGGRRVGSLGSTVNVLNLHAKDIRGKRVIICHSGGDSKRLPAYAAIGKAFVPVPTENGDNRTLLELIVSNMERLKLPRTGVLVVCGDVAPGFDFGACDFKRAGVTGVGYRDTMTEGSRHGVYVPAKPSGISAVKAFLQKPDESAAKSAGALVRGKVVVDTGIIWMDAPTAMKLAKSGWNEGDLYEKFTAELVRGFAPFRVNVVPNCDFFHIGSSAELLAQLGTGRVWIDGCAIPRSEMKLGGDNIVTFVPKSYGKIVLAKGECLAAYPVGENDWEYVRYKLGDTFKTDGKWERHRMSEMLLKINPQRLVAVCGGGSATVENPLRIDLAGGWSDTPPICYAMGGCVFNAAIMLNGVKPVRASVRRLSVAEVRVESVDLKKSGIYRTDTEIADHSDPHDWGALVKSALTAVGYRIGEGGLDIRISANVPKGSGLGTSSILGATLIQALGQVRGNDYTWSEVAALTLRLEQEMQTGGGWQDQIGGILPGVKLLTSQPGETQRIRAKVLSPTATARFAGFLDERTLIYFTGRKRMARNVLRGVLKFFDENPEGIAKAIVKRLKQDATSAFDAVERGDWRTFCEALNGYWMSKKALDAGSTNALVESIIARIAPWLSAVSLCGAGGGGFMFIVAKDRAAKAMIKRVLERHPPVKQGGFYDLKIAQ